MWAKTTEISHYEHLGHTYTSWGALKDVFIPFDTYLDASSVMGANTKLFIPGGVWLSDALLAYAGQSPNATYTGTAKDGINSIASRRPTTFTLEQA